MRKNNSCSCGQGGAGGQTTVVLRFRGSQVTQNPQDVDWGQSAGPEEGAVRWENVVRVEVYLGLGQGREAVASQLVWDEFVAQELTACFPQGFTVLRTCGVWDSMVEPGRVVIAFTNGAGPDLEAALARLAEAWARRAGQQEVLVAVTRAAAPTTSANL